MKRIQIGYDDQTPLDPGQYLVKMDDGIEVDVTAEIIDQRLKTEEYIACFLRLSIDGMPVIFPMRVATPSGALVAALYYGLRHAYRKGKEQVYAVVVDELAGAEVSKEADDG